LILIQSVIVLILSLLMTTFVGFGFSDYLTPKSLHENRLILSPVFGFLWIISSVPIISAATPFTFEQTIKICISLASALTAYSLYRNLRQNGFRELFITLSNEILEFPIYPIILSITTFELASFTQGFSKFLGTANPDFIQSWSFLDTLNRLHLNFYQVLDLSRSPNLFTRQFPTELQGRFGGIAFAGALQQFGLAQTRTALITTIATSFLVLIIIVSVYYKSVFTDLRMQKLATLVFAFGAPVGMSFIYIFIGQNATLFMFPLVLVLSQSYLKDKLSDKKALALLVFVIIGSFFAYIPITPILIFMFLISSCIWLIHRIQSLNEILRDGISAIIIFCLVIVLTWKATNPILKGYLAVLNSLNANDRNVTAFDEWHSNHAFAYFLGTSTSPISNSYLLKLSLSPITLIFAGLVFGVIALIGLISHSRKQYKSDTTILAGTITFLILIFYYATILRYGYAEFKLSSWFYFLIPAGIILTLKRSTEMKPRLYRVFMTIGILIFAVLNVFNSIEYSIKSYGADETLGTIVNSYQQSSVDSSVNKMISFFKSPIKYEQVAIALPFVESEILSGYLRPVVKRLTMLSHMTFPLDDKFLTDLTGKPVTLAGLDKASIDGLQTVGTPDFVILPGGNNPNQDIVDQKFQAEPVLSTPFYNIYRGADLKNLVVTGRGFGREEFLSKTVKSAKTPFRWSYNGIELISYFSPLPNTAFQVSFKIHFNPRITGKQTISIYENSDFIKKEYVIGDGLINFQTVLPKVGRNSFEFRWNAKNCNFDPTNPKNLNWCDYAQISNVLINQNSGGYLQPRVTLYPSELQSMASSFMGFRRDGWFQGNSNIAWSLVTSVHTCLIRFLRDGSNPVLAAVPKISILTGKIHKILRLPFGNTNVVIPIWQSNLSPTLSIAVEYPTGSTDNSDPNLQIPKGSVKLESVTCT
jgi:hypothetical protein